MSTYVDLMMKIKMRALCLFLSLICAIRTEGLSVRGPAMPLHVQLGASVTLPCSVDTPIPLHELEVQWTREDSGVVVHLFLGGESRPESQSPAYSGRAEFFTEEISKGNFSLLLRNVITEDKGMYKCVVHTEHESSETNVTIDTEWLVVTGADVPVFAYAGEDVILNCSVDTHVPLRELEVEWMKTNEEIQVLLFMEGRYRPESQPERFRGRAEFLSEEIPKGNFSMKLRDVKTEDRGEFMCIVHTDRESVNATAWLQEQGFSTLHWCVLCLTMAAAVFAVLSCIPAVWWIKKALKENPRKDRQSQGAAQHQNKELHQLLMSLRNEEEEEELRVQVESKGTVLLFFLQVSVPCILLSIAFAIWGKIESSVVEAYVCSTINLVRILVIFKVAPYVLGARHKDVSDPAKTGPPGQEEQLLSAMPWIGVEPDRHQPKNRTCYERLTNVALPLDTCLVRTGINSVLLHSVLTYHAQDVVRKLFSEFMFALVLLFDLSAVFSSGIMFTSWYQYLYNTIFLEMFLLIFSSSTFGFTAVLILWFIIPRLYNLLDYWKSDWSKKRYGYLIGKVTEVLKFILESTLYTLFLHIFLEKNKDHPALVCFMAFLWILTEVLRFNHRTNLPDVAHIFVYVFGSAVLSVLNSVALATEVFLKAEKGERTVEDLRVIVLPLESLFLAFWLGLQVYAFCMQDKKITEQLSQLFQSCKKRLRCSTSSQQDQTPVEDVESGCLSLQEQTTALTQERLNQMIHLSQLSRASKPETPEEAEKKWLRAAIEMLRLSQPAQSTTPKPEWLDAAIEMLRLSRLVQSTAPKPETPQETEETEPLSPSAENTTHTQEGV